MVWVEAFDLRIIGDPSNLCYAIVERLEQLVSSRHGRDRTGLEDRPSMEEYRALWYRIAGVAVPIKSIEGECAFGPGIDCFRLWRDILVGCTSEQQDGKYADEENVFQHEQTIEVDSGCVTTWSLNQPCHRYHGPKKGTSIAPVLWIARHKDNGKAQESTWQTRMTATAPNVLW